MYILDSDFVYAYFVNTQSTHLIAKNILTNIVNQPLFMLDLVKYELATVISRKETQQMAIDIIQDLEVFELGRISINDQDEKKIWELFKSFTKKNISFVDCANLYFAQKLNYQIASFDQFYPKDLLCQ